MDEIKEKDIHTNTSALKACRLCLKIDVTLHYVKDSYLETCLKSAVVFPELLEDRANYICNTCASYLIKKQHIVEKKRANTFQEILDNNGQVIEPEVKARTISKTGFKSSLGSHLQKKTHFNKYDNEKETSEIIKTEDLKNKIREEDENIVNLSNTDEKIVDLSKDEETTVASKDDETIVDLSEDEETLVDLIKDEETPVDFNEQHDSDVETIEVDVPFVEILSDDDGDDFSKLESKDRAEGLSPTNSSVPQYHKRNAKAFGGAKNRKNKRKNRYLRPRYQDEDKFVRRYFNIKKIQKMGLITCKRYFCKYCNMKYDCVNGARDHVISGCQEDTASSSPTGGRYQAAANAMPSSPWQQWHGNGGGLGFE